SGLFTSPNVNALMSTVPPEQRGTASGINTMVGNTGQMLSIAIAFPLVLSRIPEDVMFKVFLFGGGMGDLPDALHAFEQGLHQASSDSRSARARCSGRATRRSRCPDAPCHAGAARRSAGWAARMRERRPGRRGPSVWRIRNRNAQSAASRCNTSTVFERESPG